MNLAWDNFWKHPGSTLKAGLGLATVLLIAWGNSHPKALWCATATAMCRAALGFFQKDVGREEEIVPGTRDTKMVDAHEVPDSDPNAVVVNPKS